MKLTEEQHRGIAIANATQAKRPTFAAAETSAKLDALGRWEKWRERVQLPRARPHPVAAAAAVTVEAAALVAAAMQHDGAGAAIYAARVLAAVRRFAEDHIGDEIDRRITAIMSGGNVVGPDDRNHPMPDELRDEMRRAAALQGRISSR